ncbi:MAG: efflux RND transporter permease subunit [Spirochaetes bacterium]|nr:efflux RND transporter permease subunit [Spirochaetota bacterium]
MSAVKKVVARPVTILIVFILFIGMGIFSFINLAVDLFPDINPPFLMVFTTYPGAGPEEVERSVTRPLEAALSGASGLETVSSSSSNGFSQIVLEFTFGTDLSEATASVRDALERVRRFLPAEVDTPMIFRFDPAMIPIMSLMVTGNRTSEEIRTIAEDVIVPRIEQTPGVATATISGGREQIIRVEIPQNRLEAYNLTITQIQQAIAVQNMQTAAGTIIEDGRSFILTTMGEFTSLEEIRNTVIAYRGGGFMNNGQVVMPVPVFLRDLADVFEGVRDDTTIVLVNDQPTVMLFVQRQSGQNSVEIANTLRARLDSIVAELPPDMGITELWNTTDMIENSLNQVGLTAVSGALICIFVIFLFLRSGKPTLIIGISIPVSIVVTMMAMYFAGLTLNIMTMAGLVLGVGMLVDNSVVILENIYRYREKGTKLKTAAILGSSEMMTAIVVSTLTTICVFAPLIIFQGLLGVSGELFAGLAFTVVISLAVSLFTAAFLVPVLSSHFIPLVTRKQVPLTGRLAKIDGGFDRFFKSLDHGYRGLVGVLLNHKALTIGCIALILAFSIFMIPVVGWVFMPEEEQDSVNIRITLPVGSPLVETEATLHALQFIVRQELDPSAYTDLVLTAGGGGMMGFGAGSQTNTGTLRINLPEFNIRPLTENQIQDILRPHFASFPGVSFLFTQPGGGGGMGGGSPVEITLRTDDLVAGKATAERIADLLRTRIPDVTEPEIDLDDGLPQIEIVIDRARMYALGLNTFVVGNEIRAAVDGITATRFRSDGRDYDVVLILAEADRSTRPALDQIFVNSPMSGGRVPLSSFVHYQEGTGPITINRENQGRVINITAGIAPGARMNIVHQQVEALILSEVPATDGLIIEIGGGNAEMVDMMTSFLLICAVAAFLVFGIMASLFESFRDPFIIILTLPLSIVGIVWIYFITGEPFNVLNAVGLLVLFGVITNNGIVLIDYTNLLRKRGYDLREACIEAAGNRLRPILMTTVSTVLGLAPMAFFPGEGSQLVGPIGKTVFGGLSFGTLMTLFLMPVVYYIVNKSSDERKAKAQERREKIAAGERAVKSKAKSKRDKVAGVAIITDSDGQL